MLYGERAAGAEIMTTRQLTNHFMVLPTFFISLMAFAQGPINEAPCAHIHCDCASLPKASWINVCRAREQAIIQRCEKAHSTEGLYCTAHGPAANQLPLTLKFNKVDIAASEELSALFKRVAAIYWVSRKDVQAIEDDIEQSRFDHAQGKMNLLSRNIDNLFYLQRQITLSLEISDMQDEVLNVWKDFANDTLELAGTTKDASRRIWNQDSEKGILNQRKSEKLSLKMIENSAQLLEQAAFCFGEAGQHEQAARIWEKAAEVSQFLIDAHTARPSSGMRLQALMYQRAARLHRASYHWEKGQQRGEAQDSLEKARKMIEGNDESLPG